MTCNSLPHPDQVPSVALHLNGTCSDRGTRAVLREVMSWLSSHRVGPGTLVSVEIALVEALNNIVEHAYAGSEPGRVTLRCEVMPDQIRFRLCDRGRAMPGGTLPAGDPAQLDLPRDALPEGGFGWFLIRQLTSGLSYRREAGQNILDLSVRSE